VARHFSAAGTKFGKEASERQTEARLTKWRTEPFAVFAVWWA
jgi:hypothetical protein